MKESNTKPAEAPLPPVPKDLAEIVALYPEGSVNFYEACYRILTFDKGHEAQIDRALDRIIKSEVWPDYVKLEELRHVPAMMTGLIHSLECNNHPLGVLHNGEKIVGTGKKTSIVPKGKGPFKTFLESALDAVDELTTFSVPVWSVGWIGFKCERFNGTGYISGAGAPDLSPYIWACSNINDDYGKYVSDGKYDPKAPANGQVGCLTLLKRAEQRGIYKPVYTT